MGACTPKCQTGHDGSCECGRQEMLTDSGCISEKELTGSLTNEAPGVRGKKKSKTTPGFSPE